MKILYANDFLVYAGAEKVCRQLVRSARKHGHEAKLAAPFLNRAHKRSNQDVLATIKDWQPDLVHFHNITSVGLKPLEYCIREGIGAVWTVHDWYPVCKLRTRVDGKRRLCTPHNWSSCSECRIEVAPLLANLPKLRDVANQVEVTTLCNAQRLLMQDFGYDINHMTVVKNGVDTEAFQPLEDGGFIFCFGVHRYEKALDWHLQSAEVLPYPHVMAGEQISYRLDVKKLKSKVLGFLSEPALALCLGEASLVQIPARWHEPCGLTILESFACGKPVVTVSLGGIPEYVEDGKTGFMANAGDIVGFIDLTHYLMENEELRHKMGKNALEASRYYSLERVWHDYEQVYKKALS